MVEKPITTSVKSAEEIIKLCKKNKCILSINHSLRLLKAISRIKNK